MFEVIIVQKIILFILQKLNIANHFSDTELLEIRYSVLAIGGDLSKLFIIGFVFLKLGLLVPFLYAMVTTLPLRSVIGGFHLSTYWKCLLFSFFYFVVLILLSEWIEYQYILYTLPIASGMVLLLAPQIPLSSERTLKVSKFVTKLLAFILRAIISLVFIIKKDSISHIGPLTVFFQSIQLLLLKGVNYYEKHKSEKSIL
jgi:accessory gene regulator protein AgrB